MHYFLNILGWVILFSMSCQQESQKTGIEKNTPEESSQIKNGDVNINYNVCGDRDTTLFFVHGWCINQTYWSNQFDAFCDRYTLVSLDLPGFGNSSKNRKEWTIENYAKDINAVINHLALKNVVLIGHSMGGDIILEAALQNEEVIALIGVDNFKSVGMEMDKQIQKEIDDFINMLKSDFQKTAFNYAESFLFLPQSDSMAKKRVMHAFSNADSSIALATLESLFNYGVNEANRLSRLKQKLYLINSDMSPTNVEGLEATGVPFEVVDIHATGHYPMIEKPELFNQMLEKVLNKIYHNGS